MSEIRVSDHALLRFLERAGGLEIEALRTNLQASLARSHAASQEVCASNYLILSDGLVFVVRGGTVTTVLEQHKDRVVHAAQLMERRV